jgi:hypothetical protein
MEKETNKTKWLHLRLSEAEHAQIEKEFKKTTLRKLSEYARRILLGKPVVAAVRNRSLDDLMTELTTLRKDLNAAGNNFNQAVRKLHTLEQTAEVRRWTSSYEQCRTDLQASILLIESHISKMADVWLQ